MASKSMHLRMAKAGKPVHCADGKWRTHKQADVWNQGWDDAFALTAGMSRYWRSHYIAGIVARFKADREGKNARTRGV